MNSVHLKGNITRQPETKHLPSGTTVTEFGIAVNERWKDEQGNQKESVYFGECMCWGKRGEAIASHLNKGDPILLRGKLAQEEWEDKSTGQKRSKTRIKIEEWEFCGGKQEQTGQQQAPRQQQRDYQVNRGQPRSNAAQRSTPQQAPARDFDGTAEGDDTEIPF